MTSSRLFPALLPITANNMGGPSGVFASLRGGPAAGQRGGLPHPRRQPLLVEIVLVDVDPARVLGLAAGRSRTKRGALKEGHLDGAREDVETHEPPLTLDAVY